MTSLPSLPISAVDEILKHCSRLSKQSLRATCSVLRDAIIPTSITIAYVPVKRGAQSLLLSKRLAGAWPAATHATIEGHKWDEPTHAECGAQHRHLIQDFLDVTVPVLVDWKQLQSAALPLYSSYLATLMAVGCQLTEVKLSDRMFCRIDDGTFSEDIMVYHVSACLQLLATCKRLKVLGLCLNSIQVKVDHLKLLGCLTQLEQLDLDLETSDDPDEVEVDTYHVIKAVCKLTGLTTLRLRLGDSYCASDFELGALPNLRALSLIMDNNQSVAILDSTDWAHFASLERLTLEDVEVQSPVAWPTFKNLRHLGLDVIDLDDDLATVLAACPHLSYVSGFILKINEEFDNVLGALRELHVQEVLGCGVLRVWAPGLQVFTFKTWETDQATNSALQHHPALTSLKIPFSWLWECSAKESEVALTGLTALRCLHVNRDDYAGFGAILRDLKYWFAPSLRLWAASIRELRLDACFEHLLVEQFMALLQGMPGLQVLYLRQQDDHSNRAASKAANLLVWVVSACICRMSKLKVIDVDARLFPVDIPCQEVQALAAFLMALVTAPCLALVRIVHPGGAFKTMAEGSTPLDMFKKMQRQIEIAHQLQELPFHVEVS